MLHEYYVKSMEDHQFDSTRFERTGLTNKDTETKQSSTPAMETGPAEPFITTVGQAKNSVLAADALLPDSITGTAYSDEDPIVISEAVELESHAAMTAPTNPFKFITKPKVVVSAEVVSEPERLIKQEPMADKTYEASSVPEDQVNGEKSESEDDESSEVLSDNDEDVGEELKKRIEAINESFDKPYDPLTEPTPKLPAYHPSFAKVEKYYESVMQDAANLLGNSQYQDPKVKELLTQAEGHMAIKYPGPKRIGVVGDSGVGKSSLINSILDTPDLAMEGASGAACTSVITEFRQAWTTQISPFMAEIVLFTLVEIEVMLKGHFHDYYAYHFESTDDLDQDVLDEREGLSATASEAFGALFGGRKEFFDNDAAKEFFAYATSGDDKKILDKLIAWVGEMISLLGAKDGLIHYTADSAPELGARIEPFIKTSNKLGDDECLCFSPWPIVQVVRVGLRSPWLKHGMVIADLPGLSDVNKTRTRMTEQYIRKCHYLLLVAPIGRVQTDNLVHKRLLEYSRAKASRKALVCTRIDDISITTNPRDLEPTLEALEEYRKISRARLFSIAEKPRLISMKKIAKGRAKQELSNQIQRIGVRKSIYGALLHQALVVMRNRKVVRSMRDIYRGIASGPNPLDIFCVSNSHYTMHKTGYDEEGIPLSIDVTGVPTIRSMLSTLPAAARLRVLEQHIEGVLKEFVNSMELWSLQATNHRRLELKEIVARPGKIVQDAAKEISAYIAELKAHLEKCVLDKIENSRTGWILHGVKSLEHWATWNAQTFGAWCRADGRYMKKFKRTQSWNAELLEPVVNDVKEPWLNFHEGIDDLNEKYYSSLETLLDSIRESLSATPGVSIMPIDLFLKSLAPKKVLLRQWLDNFSSKLKAASLNIEQDVITDQHDSYIMQAMLPVYMECKAKYGKGKRIAQVTLLEHAMKVGGPYNLIGAKVKEAFDQEVTRRYPKLLKRTQNIFEAVLKDFDSMFVIEEFPSPQRDVLRRRIQEFVTQANVTINGPITIEFARMTSGIGY